MSCMLGRRPKEPAIAGNTERLLPARDAGKDLASGGPTKTQHVGRRQMPDVIDRRRDQKVTTSSPGRRTSRLRGGLSPAR